MGQGANGPQALDSVLPREGQRQGQGKGEIKGTIVFLLERSGEISNGFRALRDSADKDFQTAVLIRVARTHKGRIQRQRYSCII